MKKILAIIVIACMAVTLQNCGGGSTSEDAAPKYNPAKEAEEKASEVPASERVTLEEKGVGQIKNLELPETIDEEMAAAGGELFNTNCTACHKVDKRFIGPSPKGILERRSPEWIMNMILDPQLMVEQDRCAKDLLVEFNGAAMANQNLTVEQVRSILEYFRTL